MSLGQLFALATPNEESANGLAGLSVILSVILMGFLITVNAMPSYWEWAYWANLFRYSKSKSSKGCLLHSCCYTITHRPLIPLLQQSFKALSPMNWPTMSIRFSLQRL